MGLWECVCACVYGNDIAVKPDLQSPLPPAYWVVCFAEWLLEVGIIEISLDGQLDTLENATQYIWDWSVYVCACVYVCGQVEGHLETEKRVCSLLIKTHVETKYPSHR